MTVELYESQLNHFERLANILDDNYYAVDTSPVGAGKTIIALKIAELLGLPTLVLCPNSTVDHWKKESRKFEDVEVIDVVNFERFRSKSSSNKHLVHVTVDITSSTGLIKQHDDFDVDESLAEQIDDGMLMIIDEFQNLKNESLQRASAAAVGRQISQSENSRMLLLSNTPFDKPAHSLSFYTIIGKIEHVISTYGPKPWQNVIDIISDYLMEIDPRAASKYINRIPNLKRPAAISLAFDGIVNVLFEHFRSQMSVEYKAKQNVYKTKVPLSIEDSNMMTEALEVYNVALNVPGGAELGQLTNADDLATKAKWKSTVDLAIRDWNEVVTEDIRPKIIVYARLINVIKLIADRFELAGFNVEIMTGETNHRKGERQALIESFNQDNDDVEVLVTNVRVGSTGINLDDRSPGGTRPRRSYIIPESSFIPLLQAFGRIHRVTSTSDSSVDIIYSDDVYDTEQQLNSRLEDKDRVIKSLQEEDNNQAKAKYIEAPDRITNAQYIYGMEIEDYISLNNMRKPNLQEVIDQLNRLEL